MAQCRLRSPGSELERVGARVAVALCVLAFASSIAACGPPPFVVHVLYPGEVEVERGSPVVYRGVIVGQVASVALRQDIPQQPALIAVSLEISDRGVILRESDRFHLTDHRGVPVVEIAPAPEASAPIPSGASVAGVPPLVTRAEESLTAAVESLGAIALERFEELLEELSPPDGSVPDEGDRATGSAGSRPPVGPESGPSAAPDPPSTPAP